MLRHASPPARRVVFATLLTLAGLAGACGKPQPLGDANAIIVVVPDAAWAELEQEVYDALEPRTFTVRDERIFRVTQVDPEGPHWNDMRRFRQILLIGEPDQPWVADALAEVRGTPAAPPTVVRAQNVWAQGQQVTIALLPPGAPPASVQALLPDIGDTLLQQYTEFARQRMFVSGADSALADTLRQREGFSIILPNVYRGEQPEPNLWVFRNDQPDASRLIRSVLVTWRPAGEGAITPETALAWREEVATSAYEPPQITETERLETHEISQPGHQGRQFQGIWSNPPGGWPAAGPFIARVVDCPAQQRSYLLDAWLYAPGVDKYEYMVQLNTILDSFECGGAPR